MATNFFILMRTELVITVIIFLLLFIKLGKGIKNNVVLAITNILLLITVFLPLFGHREGNLFGDMFVTTQMIAIQKSILAFGTFLIILLNYDWLKNSVHLPEFLLLMLSALLGMFLMISSGNLLIFYLSLELATIPVAALSNFDLTKKTSSEAAMKMILSSAFSSGILLFGISLLYGLTGTLQFAVLPLHIQPVTGLGTLQGEVSLQVLAFIFFVTAFAFKLSVVPFHLWTADVYEGSPVAVTSFLSVISKGSVAFIFITALYKVFRPHGPVTYDLLLILSLLTLVTGNLFAIRQNNIKRFLAFSSIAQVGFILVGISSGTNEGVAAVVYFILIYIFSNLAAFGVVSIIATATGKETISDYKGLYKNNKLLSWMMALALFSLAGIPPTAGFFGKFFLIMTGAVHAPVWFIVVVVLNLVISLYYYLRVVRAIFMDATDLPLERVPVHNVPKIGLLICGAGIVAVGLIGWLYEYILTAS